MIHARADVEWVHNGTHDCMWCDDEGCSHCACKCEGCGHWIECADHDYDPHPPMCAVCRPRDVTK